MVPTRMRTTIAIAVVLGLGCGPGAKAKPNILDKGPAVADPLAYLPASSALTLSIDIVRLRKSPLWNAYWPQIQAAIAPQLAGVKAKCGFDPLEAITSITAATQEGSEDDVTIVVRGLPRDQTIACVMKQTLPAATAVNEGGVITLHHQSGAMNMFTFVDPTTLVLRGSKAPTKESLQAAVATASPLRDSKPFMARFDRLTKDPVMWVLMTGKGEWMTKAGGSIGEKPVAIEIAIRMTDDVLVDGRVQMETPDAAKRTVEVWEAGASALAMFLTATAKAEGDTAVISLAIKKAAIDLVLSQYGGTGMDDPPPPEEEDKPEDGE
jgi:hypothetical protein